MTSVTGSNCRLLVAKLTDLLAPDLRISLVAIKPLYAPSEARSLLGEGVGPRVDLAPGGLALTVRSSEIEALRPLLDSFATTDAPWERLHRSNRP